MEGQRRGIQVDEQVVPQQQQQLRRWPEQEEQKQPQQGQQQGGQQQLQGQQPPPAQEQAEQEVPDQLLQEAQQELEEVPQPHQPEPQQQGQQPHQPAQQQDAQRQERARPWARRPRQRDSVVPPGPPPVIYVRRVQDDEVTHMLRTGHERGAMKRPVVSMRMRFIYRNGQQAPIYDRESFEPAFVKRLFARNMPMDDKGFNSRFNLYQGA